PPATPSLSVNRPQGINPKSEISPAAPSPILLPSMSFSRLIRIIQLGLKSLLLHKLRSGLTMLGIVFGVFSVIAMLAPRSGASAHAQKQIVALGATNIIVRSINPVEGSSNDLSAGGTPRYGLTRADHKRLTKTISTITNAIPVRELQREARYLKKTMNC